MTASIISPPVDHALVAHSFRAIGTMATVVAEPTKVGHAASILRAELDAFDRACSRFRADSELEALHGHGGRPMVVTPLLFSALEVAIAVAEKTFGAVDPTVGNAIAALGYDRDVNLIGRRRARSPIGVGPVVGYEHVHLDARTRTAQIPKRVRLDLGSSAKALAADHAALRIADRLDTEVLVSIGGDVAVAGPPPPNGWAVGIAVDSSTSGPDVDQVVAIKEGGLASSSTAVRTWTLGTEQVHHIIDPSTGYCAPPYWKLVSVCGRSCVDANALSTAAIVWGEGAIDHLRSFDPAARLVRSDGEVFTVGGWPQDSTS